jgi:hypothetical protein
MRKVIGIGLLLSLVALPAFAADIAKDPNVTIQGQYSPGTPQFRQGSAIVVSITEGVFTDLGPAYQTALSNAGATPADIAYDPAINGWPNLANYDMVLVSSSDNWWMTGQSAVEGPMLQYTGCLVVVGQDYAYGTGPTAGFSARFGIASLFHDVNFGDASLMTLAGLGPFLANADSGLPCFGGVNPWFTDDVTPNGQPTADWSDGGFSGQGGAEFGGDSIFSSNEFGCMGNLQQWVDDMAAYCGIGGGTPTEQSTWSQLKDTYK